MIEIITRYIDVCLAKNLKIPEIKEHLEKFIYAVEIDEIEYQKSIQNLNKLVKDKLGIGEDLNWKLYNQNTLNFYKSHLNFFDFIVGNPPYIRIHNLDLNTKKVLKQDFFSRKEQ